MNGLEHNRWVAFGRIFSAVGAHAAAEELKDDHLLAEAARDYARFEAKRYARACYAFGTTLAAMEG